MISREKGNKFGGNLSHCYFYTHYESRAKSPRTVYETVVIGKTTRLIYKVSFPGAVYRNKMQLHGNIYCNRYSKCSAFFQHIRHRN
jgi:hypothetical protein